MDLKSARVQNYKCIEDSGEFTVSALTCLAGKNESGKTALLQALRRLNPVEEAESQFNELMEYPRRRYARRSDSGDANVVTMTWKLSDDDVAALQETLGEGALASRKIRVRRGYKNETEWDIDFSESAIIKSLKTLLNESTEANLEQCRKWETLSELQDFLRSRLAEGFDQLGDVLRRTEESPDQDLKSAAIGVLENRLPKFLYFPNYATLPGRISLDDLVRDKPLSVSEQKEGYRVFNALLALAGTEVEEIQNTNLTEELIARLESVSNSISDEIFEYWSQNRNLAVKFNYDIGRSGDTPPFNQGHVFQMRIENSRHRVSVGFDERSVGFVWFFSFLVWFSQMERIYGDNLIILLDEPGLSLHGTAQADLLRYIREQLLPKYQVIYTTHSPFMIDVDDLPGIRTVEDKLDDRDRPLGTKVGDKVLSADADTLFPLRVAIGYSMTQSLFIGEHSLLVEGPSDLLFLHWASRQLVDRGRTGLDKRWTVTPVGGITKFATFASLFAANHLQVAILSDFHQGDKRTVRELDTSSSLETGHVFYATQFTEQNEADIEDMIGWNLYSEIVNRCYELKGDNTISF